jgi:hypothetical protein
MDFGRKAVLQRTTFFYWRHAFFPDLFHTSFCWVRTSLTKLSIA